jgi:hypothetical protein
MAIAFRGPAIDAEVLNLGSLALIHPLLQELDVSGILDQHLPADDQLEFSHGRVLSLLLAARMSQPTALVNVSDWARKTAAELLWDIPAQKLNDDRLGRSLDAFFSQRHSIMAAVTHAVLQQAELTRKRLHFDTTHLIFYGAYQTSKERTNSDSELLPGNDDLLPAHITHGYLSRYKMLQAGITSVIDDLGCIPIYCHLLDGNRNGHTAMDEQLDLFEQYLPLPEQTLLISDRGTFSAAHLARLYRGGHRVLCAVPWNDYRALYDAHEATLHWQEASFLSREQQRRRDAGSSLPHEHYELAVLSHSWTDPTNGDLIPGRVIFAYSTADAAECCERRQKNIDKIQTGLEALAAKLQRGHPSTTYESMQRQITRLLGKRDAARYFRWELVALSAEELAALPPPRKGYRQPTHRLVFSFDPSAVAVDSRYDGVSALVTTVAITTSADVLFTQYKEQNYLERNHHQFKTPLAVRPVFLKSPQRVEALVCLLHIALQLQQLLERRYRQAIPTTEPLSEQRYTWDSLSADFKVCGVVVEHTAFGRVVRATRLTAQQRQILNRLRLPTVIQTLARTLPQVPTG